MNRNKTTKLLINLAVILLTACGQNELSEVKSLPKANVLVNLTSEEYASIAFDNPRELTEGEAISIAKDFIAAQEEFTGVRKTKSKFIIPTFSVIDKSYYSSCSKAKEKTRVLITGNEDLKIPIYRLSINTGKTTGIMLVSGDERAKKVIAYIPLVNKDLDLPAAKHLEELTKANLLDNIKNINHLKDSLKIKTIDKISTKLGIDGSEFRFSKIENYISVNDEPLSKSKPITTPPTQVLSYVIPMCSTEWDQSAPYNLKLPVGNVDGIQKNYYAGCGVIAIAQILAFVEPKMTVFGININWNYLKQKSYISNSDPEDKKEMAGCLIKDIYTKTGAYPVYNSNGEITGTATTTSAICSYINTYANTSSIKHWNSDNVRNSILALRPVVTAGSATTPNAAHAFIVDGYLLCKQFYGNVAASQTKSKELVKKYDLYFHANLGWGGYCDGYYLINKDTSVDFESGGYVYKTEKLKIISSIVKK